MNSLSTVVGLSIITWIFAYATVFSFRHHCQTQLWYDYNQWLIKSKLSKTESSLPHQYNKSCSNFIRKKSQGLTATNFFKIHFQLKGNFYNETNTK